MKTIYTVFLLLLLLSCTSSSEKLAWEIANNSQTNKKELTRFLEHYKTNKDKDKYKAACFLIENMPNKYSINGKEQKIYDIDIVKADSLIKSLEHSFFLKEKSPYLKNIHSNSSANTSYHTESLMNHYNIIGNGTVVENLRNNVPTILFKQHRI